MNRIVVASLILVALAGSETFAQTSAPVPEKVTLDQVKPSLGVGRRALREEALEQRRTSVDPRLNRALTRFQALQARLATERLGTSPIGAWQPFGPAPIADGQTPTSTPRHPSDVSGRTVAIAIDPVNDHIYVGAAQGGIWRSDDDGASWTPLTDDLPSLATGAIAVVPPALTGDPATIYYGTGESNNSCDSYAGIGLFKSTDGGATWTGPIGGATFANRSIASIAVDRTNSDHLLLTTSSGIFGLNCGAGSPLPDRGVFRSLDGGLTWNKQTPGNRRFATLVQDPEVATTWWAGGRTSSASVDPANEGGLYKSIDNGVTWAQVAGTGGLPALSTSWARTWVTATTDTDVPGESILYIGTGLTQSGSGQGRVFRSADSGDSWTEITAARGYCSPQCSYDNPIYAEPGDAMVLYTGGAGASAVGVLPTSFMRSVDGGASFADRVRSGDQATALHADVHFITTWPGQASRLWTSNDGGVWRSDDKGDNWVNVNSNLQITQFSGCDLHPTDPQVIYAGSQDNGTEGREGTNGNVWKHLDFGDGGFARIDQGNTNNLVHTYFNAQNQLIGVGFTTGGFATTMGGYNGSFAPDNGIAIGDRVQFYAPIHFDRGVTNTLYFGTHRLWRATDFFNNFNGFGVLNGGASLAGTSGALTAIETFASTTPGANAELIYTGASGGEVHRSINGGASFTLVDSIGSHASYVSDIVINPNNSNEVWQSRSGFGTGPGLNVRRSTDGGNSWNPAANGLPNVPVNALAYDPRVPTRMWAGTDIGAYYTEDGGTTWTPHNDGLPASAIFDLASSKGSKTLAACTHGRGVFVIQPESIFADGFELGNTSAWSAAVP